MPSHYYRAVMQRTRRVENTQQQVVTQLRIQLHSAVDHILQTDVPFDHDQRAGLGRSKGRSRQDYFIVNAFPKLTAMLPRKRHAKTITKRNQGLPDLRLEQHDNRDTDVEQPVAEHKLQRREILFD